ncbi:MAG: hypothetical protein U9R03_04250 [Candidatus Aerophobetes bacterium]|nr:hypothetical protein [Candidatus Aerophobetes bacterium]
MPEWKIHDKWAEEIGVSKEVSNFVNLLIDFPQECPEFLNFCDKEEEGISELSKSQQSVIHKSFAQRIGYDSGRRRKTDMHIQLQFLHERGSECVKAWYLHQILDYNYIKGAPILTVEEILERIESKTESCQELENVKRFVIYHSSEILQDCR